MKMKTHFRTTRMKPGVKRHYPEAGIGRPLCNRPLSKTITMTDSIEQVDCRLCLKLLLGR